MRYPDRLITTTILLEEELPLTKQRRQVEIVSHFSYP